MIDPAGRCIDYARISVTDRCNLRCVYCMPAEGVPKRNHADILTFEEIERVCRAFADSGIRTLKLTGGEPLVRRGIVSLAEALRNIPGIRSVTLTTNGILLPPLAADLRSAGIDGVNISLDTLDPDRYRAMTRGGRLAEALAGLEAALAAGFPAVKVNCVSHAGSEPADFLAAAALARELPVHVRFIGVMPLGAAGQSAGRDSEALPRLLQEAFGSLVPAAGPPGRGPAEYYSLPGFQGCIGFIRTHEHGICGRCSRLRLTADGVLKSCLHMDRGTGLRPVLAGGDAGALRAAVEEAVRNKPARHQFGRGQTPDSEDRPMSQIGG